MNYRYLLPFLSVVAAGLLGLAFSNPEAPVVQGGPIVAGDVAWMLTASGLVMLMTPGLSFFYGGMVRRKNIISTMLQSLIALGVVSLLWVIVGFSLCFGDSIGGEGWGLVGNPFTFFMLNHVGGATHPDLSPTIPLALFALFQLKFAVITPALVTGSFAERVRFTAYLVFIVLYVLFIYSPVAHWTWHPNGFLRNLGVLDYAGGTVVHLTAGVAALAGAMFLGRRRDHSPQFNHTPANIPFVILGTGMLWFGWFGFNAGSALAANESAVMAFLTTNTASAAAMLTWIFFDGLRGTKPSAMGACIGAVVGLVAITPAAGYVSVGASMLIGVIAAVISNLAVHWKNKTDLDDTLDVFPCHGVGGISGVILTGVFARGVGLYYGETSTFLYHLLAIVIVGVYSFVGAWGLLWLVNRFIPLRVSAEQEAEGLDISQHGESYHSAQGM
jgi:ammonium transporter, Amt family